MNFRLYILHCIDAIIVAQLKKKEEEEEEGSFSIE
jgi:hypothetical protein